jgi:glycosyltransferase involved in cell wall biosynthesis
MRILIDTTYRRRAPLSGTGVYITRLSEALRDCADIDLVEVTNARRRSPAGGGLGSWRNLLGDLWWAEIELPRLARRAQADVVHHPLPVWVARGPRSALPQVLTVHDLSFERLPECFDPRFRRYAHHAHRTAARAADALVCVSQTTAGDVRELWHLPAERIIVAPHGPGQLGGPVAGPPGHFLYVGDDEPRRNLRTLMAAYRLYRQSSPAPFPLVLAGSASADGPGVELEPRPSSERLRELYAQAVALVQPSLYEGFGLTALEAMSAGTPVLAAQSPGLEEVCGSAAWYAQPRDPVAFAAAMSRLATDAALREELTRLGLDRASEFSWAASAQAHLEAYRLAVARRADRGPAQVIGPNL